VHKQTSGHPQNKLPVTYYANSKAQMTPGIFRDVLLALDAFFGAQGKKSTVASLILRYMLCEECKDGFFTPELHQCHTGC
jgi:hypothetical protein